MEIYLALFFLLLNIPFGMWRIRLRRLSFWWFVAIHAPVPLVIGLRILTETDRIYAIVFVLTSLAGQITGGIMGNKLIAKQQKKVEKSNVDAR